jgi:hypothetical protein
MPPAIPLHLAYANARWSREELIISRRVRLAARTILAT